MRQLLSRLLAAFGCGLIRMSLRLHPEIEETQEQREQDMADPSTFRQEYMSVPPASPYPYLPPGPNWTDTP